MGHKKVRIQADTWARFQGMRGLEVRFVCADDARGTHIHHGHSTDATGSHAPARSIHARLPWNQQRLPELLTAGVAGLRYGLIVHAVTPAIQAGLNPPKCSGRGALRAPPMQGRLRPHCSRVGQASRMTCSGFLSTCQ